MNIILRDYRPEDAAQVVEVYRDSNNTLRKSRGGTHPDDAVDKMVKNPDRDTLDILTRGCFLLVAEAEETGEIAGITSFSNGWIERLMGSVCSRGFYVKEKFQRGRAGVSVGKLLAKARVKWASEMGFRKMYGYSTPESTGFHEKFGAKFFASHDSLYAGAVRVHYYEIELRPSRWNGLRFEPYVSELIKFYYNASLFLRHKLRLLKNQKGQQT